MEIYNNLESKASKEFKELLNNEISKTKEISEGKIIEGTITKITEKYIFLYHSSLKSEAVIDINELKSMGLSDKIKENEKLKVLLERIEDREGNVVVSASKAAKISGWDSIVESYEKNEPINGKIVSKCKGGVIFEHTETKSLLFMPGSQISERPMKDISSLMNEVIQVAIIKLDKVRGNACVSRRQIITSHKQQDKAKIIEKYKVGDIIKDAVVKGFSSFGVFFECNNELDCLVHLQEISYSRVNHPEEMTSIGNKHDLLVISVDKEKQQVGCSIKKLRPDPFEDISNYELNKEYLVKVCKLMDFGTFVELQPGLTCLLHASEMSWTKKNPSAKKLFKIGDEIPIVITEIDREKRRVSVSHRLTKENPYTLLSKKHSEGSIVEGTITTINDYAIYVRIDGFGIDGFLHASDLSYDKKPEEELKKYQKDQKIKVKILEIKSDLQKLRVSIKHIEPDPYDWFLDKKINDIVTVKIVETNSKGLIVVPEGAKVELQIKKSQIAINPADARPNRFLKNDRTDAAIQELDLKKKKVSLSIKLLEEIQNKEAVSKFSSPMSGKNLPFSQLSDKLSDKLVKKKKE